MRLKPEWVSEWPANIIPNGAEMFVYEDGGCVVKGFRLDGVVHIQDVSLKSDPEVIEARKRALSALKVVR